MVYTFDEILPSLKKEGNPVNHDNMEDILLSEMSQSQRDRYHMIPSI